MRSRDTSLLPCEIKHFYAGRAGSLHTFRVDDAGDGDFLLIIITQKVYDLRVLAFAGLLGLGFHLWLDLYRRILLLRSAHAADELAGFLWCEIFRVLLL